MTPRTSSGTWSRDSGGGGGGGGGGGIAARRPPDIIDLDRFMRGGVRPSVQHRGDDDRARLVVDAGGASRKPQLMSAGGARVAVDSASSISGSPAPPNIKRFSHDSGLSDGSYRKRKQRPHRRASGPDGGGGRVRETTSVRPSAGSSSSLRAFRVACERALREQQAQIAHVAQLCERLTACREPRPEPTATAESSEISSSSRSTRDQRRKDKHRTDECKTYKIIMNKLEELNRLFVARARSPRSPAPAPPPPRYTTSSVSVSDKLVSTEPTAKRRSTTKTVAPSAQVQTCLPRCAELPRFVERGVGDTETPKTTLASAVIADGRENRNARATSCRCARQSITNAYLEVVPVRQNNECHNISTRSALKCSSFENSTSSSCNGYCNFNLDDPVHLYSEAKRAKAMHATSRRARSAEPGARLGSTFGARLGSTFGARLGSAFGARLAASAAAGTPDADVTLCALCRGYWRSLRHYLAAQIFCRPDS